MKRGALVTAIFVFAVFTPFKYAHAYIDPGTGSYFIQIIFASIVGLSLVFKDTLFQIKNKITQVLFKNKSSDGDDKEE